jgi:hypothetical protein
MNEAEMKELERILANEEELQPSLGFSTRVMRAVREEARATEPIAFPWARFLPGFLCSFALLFGTAVWILVESGSSPQAWSISLAWSSDPQLEGLLWAALTVVGSGTLAWTTSRWGAPRRATSF